MSFSTDLATRGLLALVLLAWLAAAPISLLAQEGLTDERSAMAPASEGAGLDDPQQAHMTLMSAQRQQKQAEKYERKAAEAKSDDKRIKLMEKAKSSFEGAIRDYVTALRMDNTQYEAYVGLGELFAKAGQLEQSLESFRQALELDPENSDALLGRARVQLTSFKVEDAKTTYGVLRSLDDKSADLFLTEMRAWLEAQKSRLGPEMAEAIEDLDGWISEQEAS